jgi:hypothetical protein
MTRVVECLGLAVLWSSAALGQSTAVRPAFEVASVKPSKPGTPGFIGPAPGGQRFTATNATVRMLIMMAYNVTDRQVSGAPGWIASEGYDIDAKAERPTTREQLYPSDAATRFGGTQGLRCISASGVLVDVDGGFCASNFPERRFGPMTTRVPKRYATRHGLPRMPAG